MERKNTILLTVIAIATLLVAVVGATFAYFTATVTGDGNTDNKNTSSVNTAVLASIDYTSGSNFNLTDAFPGAKGIQTFSVTPTGETGAKGKYVITLTPDAGNTLLTHIRYTLYKVKKADDATNKIELGTVGTIQEGDKFTSTDTFVKTGSLTTVGTADTNITATTKITLETVSFTMGTDGDAYTYYLAYEFENDSAVDQKAEMGKAFNAKVNITLDVPSA